MTSVSWARHWHRCRDAYPASLQGSAADLCRSLLFWTQPGANETRHSCASSLRARWLRKAECGAGLGQIAAKNHVQCACAGTHCVGYIYIYTSYIYRDQITHVTGVDTWILRQSCYGQQKNQHLCASARSSASSQTLLLLNRTQCGVWIAKKRLQQNSRVCDCFKHFCLSDHLNQ